MRHSARQACAAVQVHRASHIVLFWRLLALLLLTAAPVHAQPCDALRWQPIQPSSPYGNVMVFDTAREKIVLYTRATTWEWENDEWIPKSLAGPANVVPYGMVYDEARRRSVLAGWNQESDRTETWEWDGTSWAKRGEYFPFYRSPTLVYDGVREQVILVAGSTWAWDGHQWTVISHDGPSDRSYSAMAYDAHRRVVVLFGGRIGVDTLNAETWEWDGAIWTRRDIPGPSARFDHAMAYDHTRQRIVLIGGGAPNSVSDVWEFDGTVWIQITAADSVSRAHHPACYDAARREVVTIGGSPGPVGVLMQAWNGQAWTTLGNTWPSSTSANSLRLCARPGTDRLLLILSPGVRLPLQTWEWDGHKWSLFDVPGPPLRAYPALGGARDGAALFYGGVNSGTYLHDTWTWNGASWTSLGTDGNPGNATAQRLVYDPVRRETLLTTAFPSRWRGDEWYFGGPTFPSRAYPGVCFDSHRDRVVLYGGTSDPHDTWEWDGSEWTQIFSDSIPQPPRGRHGMAYDPIRQLSIVFGGLTGLTTTLNDTWAWNGTDWTQLDAGYVPPRDEPGMAFDTVRGNIVMYGGHTINDMWELRPISPPSAAPVAATIYAAPGDTASLAATAYGDLPLFFQWTRDGAPVADNERVSGAASSTLQILDVQAADFGVYDLTVSNPCSSLSPIRVHLVETCSADFNRDGALNSFDFFSYITDFFALRRTSDIDGNGTINTLDLFSFFTAFFAGCS